MERDLFAALDPKQFIARVRPVLGDGTSVLVGLHIAMNVLRIGSSLVLTRLLAPEAYGVVGIVTSVSYVLTMVSDMGLRAFVTRHKTADEHLLQTVWTIRFIRNVILGSLMFVGADVLAGLYAAPEVAPALRVAAGLFLIDSITSMSLITGVRERRVIRISVINFARFLFVTTVTISVAYFLRNYWAVIVGMFAGSAFGVYASYKLVPGHRPRFRLDRAEMLDLWQFSRFVIPASIISIVLTQTDKFFLANFFPLSELGKFMLATTIAFGIRGLITEYVMRVFYPLFAQAHRKDPETAANVFYQSRRSITILLALGTGGVIGGGDLIVRILFNDLYIGTGFYLAILCFQPLAKLSTFPAEQALIAKGFIRLSLVANIIRLAWVLVAGPIAYYLYGPIAVVIVMSLVETALMPFFWWNQRRYGIFKWFEELLILVVAAAGFGLGYLGNAAINWLIAAGHLPSF